MSIDYYINQLKQFSIFNNLTDNQYAEIGKLLERKEFRTGEILINEGDISDDMYLIIDGEVEVFKRMGNENGNGDGDGDGVIATLKKGEIIGEMRIMESMPRSATVRAIKPTVTFKIAIRKLSDDVLLAKIKNNLGLELSKRLRSSNEVTVNYLRLALNESRARNTMAKFIINFVVLNTVYAFGLTYISKLSNYAYSTTLVSMPLILFFAVCVMILAKQMHYPMSMYGLTTKNWKVAVVESVSITSLILIAAFIFEYVFLHYYFGIAHPSIVHISINSSAGAFDPRLIAILIFGYALFVPLQEFIVRGVFQSAFEDFFTGPHKIFSSIVVSNLIFSMAHVFISMSVGLTVFVPGLFWGWLYSRHRTLIGVIISHIMIGVWGILFAGF